MYIWPYPYIDIRIIMKGISMKLDQFDHDWREAQGDHPFNEVCVIMQNGTRIYAEHWLYAGFNEIMLSSHSSHRVIAYVNLDDIKEVIDPWKE